MTQILGDLAAALGLMKGKQVGSLGITPVDQSAVGPTGMAHREQQRTPERTQQIIDILRKNQDKNFVQRILKPSGFPIIMNPNGSYSTHLMAAETVEGKNGRLMHIVFPTIIQSKTGQLKQLPLKDAIRHAMTTKEYIQFPSLDDAIDFSINYKAGAGIDEEKGVDRTLR